MTDRNFSAPSGTEHRLGDRDLQDQLLSTEDVESFLQRLADIAADVLVGQISAGVTMVRDGHPTTVASSDAQARQYDEIQYGHDTGPCLTAMRTGEIVLVDDLAAEDRFGGYREPALSGGVRSSLSLPLRGGDHAIGALNLYSGRVHAFGPDKMAESKRFADEASRALALAMRLTRYVGRTDEAPVLVVVDRAVGVVMAQNRCNADDAFAMLRGAARDRELSVRAIAEEIVDEVAIKAPGPVADSGREDD